MNIIITIDLPVLQSIQLGYGALAGIDGKSCGLVLQSNIELIKYDSM